MSVSIENLMRRMTTSLQAGSDLCCRYGAAMTLKLSYIIVADCGGRSPSATALYHISLGITELFAIIRDQNTLLFRLTRVCLADQLRET